MSNSLHSDQDQGSDLGPSCLYLGYQWMKKKLTPAGEELIEI